MKLQKSAINHLLVSALIILIGLVLAFAGLGMKGMGGALDLGPLFAGMLVVTILSFVLGLLRYSLATGITMAVVTLKDQLMCFALVSILGAFIPQEGIAPLIILFTVVFTYSQSLLVLRAQMDLRAANSRRDMNDQAVAYAAVATTRNLRVKAAVIALLFMVGGAICGLYVAMIPLLLGLLMAFASACLLTAPLWAAASARFTSRKGGR
jgi:hypothetical protein